MSTELLYVQKKQKKIYRSEYDVDFWREVKKRWLVLGVLVAVLAAVVAPSFGEHGGNYMHAHS